MPWKEVDLVSLRREFVQLAIQENVYMTTLCDRFGISTKTGYKWLHRFQQDGETALENQSRRPHQSPNRCSPAIEEARC